MWDGDGCEGNDELLSFPVGAFDLLLYPFVRGASVLHSRFADWLSGNTLVSINEVTVRRARLILGWVTVSGQVHHLGTQPITQVYSASYPPWDGKMSISVQADGTMVDVVSYRCL